MTSRSQPEPGLSGDTVALTDLHPDAFQLLVLTIGVEGELAGTPRGKDHKRRLFLDAE